MEGYTRRTRNKTNLLRRAFVKNIKLAFIVIFVFEKKVIFYVEKKSPGKLADIPGKLKEYKKYDITLHVSCCFH